MEEEFIKVTDSGDIKKKLISKGLENNQPSKNQVITGFPQILLKNIKVHLMIMNATENMLEGYQMTQYTLTLGNGSVNEALEKAILTMNLGEVSKRSEFLIDQKYFPQYESQKPIQYSIEMIRFGKPANSPWKLNAEERYQASALMKNYGNEQIKKQDYKVAQDYYEKGNRLIWQDTGKLVEPLQIAIKQNLILTYIKTGNNEKASELADQILEKDQSNIKIMLRKAVALENLGDFKEAKTVLEVALKIDPNNQEIIKEINSLQEKQKNQIKKEKNVYTKMFS